MRTLYPSIRPNAHGTLDRGDGHRVAYETSGNPGASPVVVLHGGPGSGSDAEQRRVFDPNAFHIVQYDQRGCGRSTPLGALHHNTTAHLIDDIEALRRHLGITSWVVAGGSWGSTLALAYAQRYPDRVRALVLRGVFLLRAADVAWFYRDGARHMFPQAWDRFVDPVPHEERGDLLSAYGRLLSGTHGGQAAAVDAWLAWEQELSALRPTIPRASRTPAQRTAFAQIECHYFRHRGFFASDTALLEGVPKIRHIPATLIQGRYDVVCPMQGAWALARAWPEAKLRVVPDAGHSSHESGIVHELVEATDALR